MPQERLCPCPYPFSHGILHHARNVGWPKLPRLTSDTPFCRHHTYQHSTLSRRAFPHAQVTARGFQPLPGRPSTRSLSTTRLAPLLPPSPPPSLSHDTPQDVKTLDSCSKFQPPNQVEIGDELTCHVILTPDSYAAYDTPMREETDMLGKFEVRLTISMYS